ncbi:MAG: DUF3592 domain-containing protein [Clostridia bacterium]|nr:DUF3592 domain-containing protein [Clostridia bacterium]
MKWYKPLVRANGKVMVAVLLLAGILMVGLGVYFGFVRTNGYEKTAAVITDLEKDSSDPENVFWYPVVKYTVNGTEYERKLDSNVNNAKIGDEIKIKYDPADPQKAYLDSPGMIVYLIAAGGVILVAAVFVIVKNRMQLSKFKEQGDKPLFDIPQRGDEERSLYFLSDFGTAKGTCHIEDRDRNVVYELKCRKFSLLADSEYEFLDRTTNRSVIHYIGKPVTTSSSSFWVLDNHSTFSIDGADIWKKLHESGITIETSLDGIRFCYTIKRNNEQIAYAESTSKYVHEEDEEAHSSLAKLPFRGFFRIRTKELNLDIIFMVLFAIGRTDMMMYD